MKQSVNQRIKQLREHLTLSQSEFAVRATISIGNVWNIENTQVTPSAKTLRAIQTSFNVNPEWLKNGKGEMLETAPIAEEAAINPYRDVLVKELKEEVSFLRELVSQLAGKKTANFLRTLDVVGNSRRAAA